MQGYCSQLHRPSIRSYAIFVEYFQQISIISSLYCSNLLSSKYIFVQCTGMYSTYILVNIYISGCTVRQICLSFKSKILTAMHCKGRLGCQNKCPNFRQAANRNFQNFRQATAYLSLLLNPPMPVTLQTSLIRPHVYKLYIAHIHCTKQKPIQVFARPHEKFLTNFGEIYRSYNKLWKIYANFRVV